MPTQNVYVKESDIPDPSTLTAGVEISIPLMYSTSDDNNKLSGLAVNIHFNSNMLVFKELAFTGWEKSSIIITSTDTQGKEFQTWWKKKEPLGNFKIFNPTDYPEAANFMEAYNTYDLERIEHDERKSEIDQEIKMADFVLNEPTAENGLVSLGAKPIQETVNSDLDPNTTHKIPIVFASFNSEFPNLTLPTKLCTIKFRVAKGVDLSKTSTTINYITDPSVQVTGYTVNATPTIIGYVNKPPVITNAPSGHISVNENTTFVHKFTANEVVLWSLIGGPDKELFTINTSSGELSFNTAPDYENPGGSNKDNTYNVTVRASDTDGIPALTTDFPVTINVTNVDDTAPIITGPSGSPGASTSSISVKEHRTFVNKFTADEVVTWSLSGGADVGKFTINASGELSFNTEPDYENPGDSDSDNIYHVTVRATDNAGNYTNQEVTINVDDVDDTAPIITGSGAIDVVENTTFVQKFRANETVNWSLSGKDHALFQIDSLGNLSFNTAPDYENPGGSNRDNTYNVTVRATDNDNNYTDEEVIINVTNVDEDADIGGDISGSDDEDGDPITGKITATDVEGLTDGTYFTVTSPASNGTAEINSETGNWSYTPNPNYNGSDQFTVTVTDDKGGTSTQVVSVTVNAVDDTAVINGDTSGSGNEDTKVTGTIKATDVDGLTDKTYFTVTSPASNGTATIAAETGAWAYTPNPNYNGSDQFTVTVTDDVGGTSIQIISVNITQVQDSTIFTGDIDVFVDKGVLKTGRLVATDADGISNPNYTISIGPTYGTATIDEVSGDWSYTPKSGYIGTDSFTVTVTDNLGKKESKEINLSVVDKLFIIGPSGIQGLENDSKSIITGNTDVHQFTVNKGGDITWGLSGGDDKSFFNIDNGLLTFNDPPSFKNPRSFDGDNTYEVTVKASSSDEDFSQNVTITVALITKRLMRGKLDLIKTTRSNEIDAIRTRMDSIKKTDRESIRTRLNDIKKNTPNLGRQIIDIIA